VSVKVTNTGTRRGKHSVLLFATDVVRRVSPEVCHTDTCMPEFVLCLCSRPLTRLHRLILYNILHLFIFLALSCVCLGKNSTSFSRASRR
jgi:hypothetical protein